MSDDEVSAVRSSVPLGPHIPAWAALRAALDTLVSHTRAELAAVVDRRAILWCWSTPRPPLSDRWRAIVALADVAYREDIAMGVKGTLSVHRRSPRLGAAAEQRGLRVIEGGRPDSPLSRRALVSVAGSYVLVVWGAEEDPRPLMRRASPRISDLVGALPPPDGPSSPTAAEAALRARPR